MKEDKLTQLQDKIGYHFQNLSLLNNALTHSSYANERHWKYERNNERLYRTLGDRVHYMIEIYSRGYRVAAELQRAKAYLDTIK